MPIDVNSNGEDVAEVNSREAKRPTTIQTGAYKPRATDAGVGKPPKHERKLTSTVWEHYEFLPPDKEAEANEFKFEVINTEVRNCMGSTSPFWNAIKASFTVGLISLTISDRYASISHVDGHSMSPTLNPSHKTFIGRLGVYVLHPILFSSAVVGYGFSCGSVDWASSLRLSHQHDTLKIREGHCWVEGDNSASSLDSRSFGPVPLGLAHGRVTHIVWPPHRIGRVERMSFHCRHGRAYLFDNVVNITVGEKEERLMMTGMHTVVDIFCVGCGASVGWKYEAAHEKSQKYKEGKFILERTTGYAISSVRGHILMAIIHIVLCGEGVRYKVYGPNGREYVNSQEAQLGSDTDEG
ncbi:hypothetical protein Cgig2_018620 [Carnegiea gigantea]|uniref:Yippee domain-containing protein n=1 Tax=Carnegiea gigantea TaxID=171969 RepID=A0A9Q1QHU9_9CARY|nr:hypothetical protein Cgig2_018620 [Carnegiea gigantea]